MKNLLRASVALIAVGVSVVTHAADMPTKAPPAPVSPPPYNWSGLYVGANFGGAWTSGNLNIPANNFHGGITEFIGGGQVGYNFQFVTYCLASRVISTEPLSAIRRCRRQHLAP